MITGSNCDCLICRLEKSLIAELGDDRMSQEYRSLTASSATLASFRTALDLIHELHTPEDPGQSSSGDSLLLGLLRLDLTPTAQSIWQQLLLLAFIPTIHRTASQIAGTFASLARDDISQHVVVAFLEFLRSTELHTRSSHIAFTIARKLRRNAFRWAIHESRGSIPDESAGDQASHVNDAGAREPLHAEIVLRQFLDNCQQTGSLSAEERDLLFQFKIEGVSCLELARRDSHSAVAIQHRIQRLLDRLRRVAQRTGPRSSEQLELFPR
jgi:DNA-directed RNA polymerase specialized sigma24 family protein